MSNKSNDQLIENAEQFVTDKMLSNPTIPPEAFGTLVNEEIAGRLESLCDTVEEDCGYDPATGEY